MAPSNPNPSEVKFTESEQRVKTVNISIPEDFEGGIYVGNDELGRKVFILVHRDEADQLFFPPKGYKYKATDNPIEIVNE